MATSNRSVPKHDRKNMSRVGVHARTPSSYVRGRLRLGRVGALVGCVVLFALVLGACDWPMFGYDPTGARSSSDTGLSASTVHGLTTEWASRPTITFFRHRLS